MTCTVYLDLQKLLAFPPHVNFDQSKSSCHDMWCCILVRFTNIIAKFRPKQTVRCEMEPKRLKNATMYSYFCLWSGPNESSSRCETIWKFVVFLDTHSAFKEHHPCVIYCCVLTKTNQADIGGKGGSAWHIPGFDLLLVSGRQRCNNRIRQPKSSVIY